MGCYLTTSTPLTTPAHQGPDNHTHTTPLTYHTNIYSHIRCNTYKHKPSWTHTPHEHSTHSTKHVHNTNSDTYTNTILYCTYAHVLSPMCTYNTFGHSWHTCMCMVNACTPRMHGQFMHPTIYTTTIHSKYIHCTHADVQTSLLVLHLHTHCTHRHTYPTYHTDKRVHTHAHTLQYSHTCTCMHVH